MLDFRMDTFLAVCRHMNFTKAARELHITQPAVTQHIHFIEKEYGIQLFSFQGKKISLTGEGRRLLGAVTTMKHDDMALRRMFDEGKAGKRQLIFGVTMTIGEYVIGRYLAAYIRRHPATRIRLSIANTEELLGKLDRGEIDFALVEGFFDQDKYESRLLKQESFFGICAPHHPLAGQKVALPAVLQERLFVQEAGSGTRAVLEQALRQQNRTVRHFASLAVVSDFSTIKALVMEGLGISFVYAPVAERELQNQALARFDLDTGPLWGPFSFVCLKHNLFASSIAEWMAE